MVANLDRHQILQEPTVCYGPRLLILAATPHAANTRKILENVTTGLFQRDHFLHRLSPKRLKTAFQELLGLERLFFEPPPCEGQTTIAYHGFLLDQNRLYPLHPQDTQTCYVYRSGKLLRFHLLPHQFVQLQPQDLVLLAMEPDITRLVDTLQVPLIRKLLAYPLIASANHPLWCIQEQINGYFAGLYLAQAPQQNAVTLWHLLKTLATTRRPQVFIGLFALMWLLAAVLKYGFSL